jgi:hypothetical protein
LSDAADPRMHLVGNGGSTIALSIVEGKNRGKANREELQILDARM